MDKSVFISYRRNVSGYPARAVFQDLRANDIDAFMDIESIDSGQFDTIILNQIAARPYFLVILGPGCLERCAEAGDWLRREIECAMELKREIIPLLTSEFKFDATYAAPYLTGKLEALPRYNAVNVPLDYFEEAMNRLRTRFLKPINLPNKPTSKADQSDVQRKIAEAEAEPLVTAQQLSAQEYFEQALARPESDQIGKIADYNEAIRLNPQYDFAYNNRGFARYRVGETDGAMADYNEAIRLNPQLAIAYVNRGNAHYANIDLDEAMADYAEAIRLDPQFADAYYNRGNAYDAYGDLDRAFSDYSKAIQLDPQNAIAYINRGAILSTKGDFNAALADYNVAIGLDSQSADAYYNRGATRDAKRDVVGACVDFREALRLAPNHINATLMRGYIAKQCPNLNDDGDRGTPVKKWPKKR